MSSLIWVGVPDYSHAAGIETAVHLDFVGDEPYWSMTSMTVRPTARLWARKEHWKQISNGKQSAAGCRHSKMFIDGPWCPQYELMKKSRASGILWGCEPDVALPADGRICTVAPPQGSFFGFSSKKIRDFVLFVVKNYLWPETGTGKISLEGWRCKTHHGLKI